MSYWSALALIFFSGLAGGLVYAISFLVDLGKGRKKSEAEKSAEESGATASAEKRWNSYKALQGVPIVLFLLGRGLVGAGGAAAAVLVLLATKHYSNLEEPENRLFLTVFCFVAGFVGHLVLPDVARQLRQRLSQLEKETEKIDEKIDKVDEAVEAAKDSSNINLDIGLALRVVESIKGGNSPDLNVVRRRINDLEGWRKRAKYHADRKLNMVLARLYAWGLADPDKAIKVLEDFTREKLEQGAVGKDHDFADAMFNIASYYAKKWEDASEEEKEKAKSAALQALRTSVEIWPQNAEDAQAVEKGQDGEQFKTLAEDPEFRKIMNSVKKET